MRLLSLCTACTRAKDGQLSYTDAAKAMGLSSDEPDKSATEDAEDAEEKLAATVEEWVMVAIKTGLVVRNFGFCIDNNKKRRW